MDKKLKAKWVKALRSGKYEQAHGAMKGGGAYCCLGVLREIIAPKSRAMAACGEYLGPTHAEKAGLDMKQMEHLARMNDGSTTKGIERHSFRQIADYIEAKL